MTRMDALAATLVVCLALLVITGHCGVRAVPVADPCASSAVPRIGAPPKNEAPLEIDELLAPACDEDSCRIP